MSKLVKYRRVIHDEYIVTVELPDDESPENEAIEDALQAIEGELVDGTYLEGQVLRSWVDETDGVIVKVESEHYEFPGWDLLDEPAAAQEPAIK